MTALDTARLYGLVAADLAQVEETLKEVSQVEYDWLANLTRQVLGTSGKRMRPVLTLLTGKVGRFDPALHIPMATSVELLHTATLVHDDTLDKAMLRRGMATVNHDWNDGVAVLFGDYLFAAAAAMVARTANVRVMRLFAETLRTICGGELAQQFAAYHWQTTREEYYQRIRQKTAALFAMAAESGAALSGAPEEQVQALRRYAYDLGVAFQIMDDILDFTGDEATLGKPAGGDLREGTLTLPAILLVEQQPQQSPIQHLFEQEKSRRDVREAVEAVRASSVLEQAHEIAEEFCRSAVDELRVLPQSPIRDALSQAPRFVLERAN